MIKKRSTEKPSKLQRQMTDLEKSGTEIKKKTTEELWGREEYFQALIENSLDIIIVVNKKGTVTYVSPSVERFLGYKPGELIGKSAFKFIIPADLPRAIYDFGKAILTKEVVIPNSFGIRRKDRSECILEGVGKNLLNNPSVRGFVMNVRDVTRRKQAEDVLKAREKELEIKTKNLEDINTALNVLLKKREGDKTELEEKILLNIKQLVEPYIAKLKQSGLDERQKVLAGILESNLKDIASSFAFSLSSRHLNLTPNEVKVANLIKQDRTSKEICEILGSSEEVVAFHRQNIRRKLGLLNKKVNLKTYLMAKA